MGKTNKFISTGFDKITISETKIYSSADKNSTVLITVPANTKITTSGKTKFFFKVTNVEGFTNIDKGYILKTQVSDNKK